MPKTKTHSSAKKRFKITGAGKLLRRKAMQSHNLEKKSAKRKRAFTRDLPLSPADEQNVRKLFPGKVK